MFWKVNKPKIELDFHPEGLWTQIEREKRLKFWRRTKINKNVKFHYEQVEIVEQTPIADVNFCHHRPLFWHLLQITFNCFDVDLMVHSSETQLRTMESFKLKFYIQNWMKLFVESSTIASRFCFCLIQPNPLFFYFSLTSRMRQDDLRAQYHHGRYHSRLQIDLWNLWYDELLYVCLMNCIAKINQNSDLVSLENPTDLSSLVANWKLEIQLNQIKSTIEEWKCLLFSVLFVSVCTESIFIRKFH